MKFVDAILNLIYICKTHTHTHTHTHTRARAFLMPTFFCHSSFCALRTILDV